MRGSSDGRAAGCYPDGRGFEALPRSRGAVAEHDRYPGHAGADPARTSTRSWSNDKTAPRHGADGGSISARPHGVKVLTDARLASTQQERGRYPLTLPSLATSGHIRSPGDHRGSVAQRDTSRSRRIATPRIHARRPSQRRGRPDTSVAARGSTSAVHRRRREGTPRPSRPGPASVAQKQSASLTPRRPEWRNLPDAPGGEPLAHLVAVAQGKSAGSWPRRTWVRTPLVTLDPRIPPQRGGTATSRVSYARNPRSARGAATRPPWPNRQRQPAQDGSRYTFETVSGALRLMHRRAPRPS